MFGISPNGVVELSVVTFFFLSFSFFYFIRQFSNDSKMTMSEFLQRPHDVLK